MLIVTRIGTKTTCAARAPMAAHAGLDNFSVVPNVSKNTCFRQMMARMDANAGTMRSAQGTMCQMAPPAKLAMAETAKSPSPLSTCSSGGICAYNNNDSQDPPITKTTVTAACFHGMDAQRQVEYKVNCAAIRHVPRVTPSATYLRCDRSPAMPNLNLGAMVRAYNGIVV